MSATPRRFFDLFGVLRILVALVIFITLSFIPIRGTPSLADWAQAYIRGKGKPHFVIAGTPEGRMNELFTRFPDLDPEWRDVPPEENGYVLLREFALGKAASQLALSNDLRIMLTEDWKWSENAARQFLDKNRDAVNELRRISLLPDQSSKGKSVRDVQKAPPDPALADALVLSFKQNIRAKRMPEALVDLTALYGFAAHLDQHEVPTFKDKAAAIQVRLAPQDSVCKALKDAPANMDWKPWISVLQNVPSYGQQMQAAWRGEAWAEFLLSPAWRSVEREKNLIWDFTEFEDAYARRVLASAKAYANASMLPDLAGLAKLPASFASQETNLSKGAREMLPKMTILTQGLEKEAIRAETRFNLTIAALQLIQSELEEGPIPSNKDMRLSSLAIDPSNGKPFVFDAPLRELSPAAGSALEGQEPVKLPRW